MSKMRSLADDEDFMGKLYKKYHRKRISLGDLTAEEKSFLIENEAVRVFCEGGAVRFRFLPGMQDFMEFDTIIGPLRQPVGVTIAQVIEWGMPDSRVWPTGADRDYEKP